MKRNDKIVAGLGAIILILAAIGIYFWVPLAKGPSEADVDNFVDITGKMNDMPEAFIVADTDPFYPIIATPISLNYNEECELSKIPLLIKNVEKPSSGVTKVIDQIGIFDGKKTIYNNEDAKQVSIDLAREYWESSPAALIIEKNQSGYELGVVATPIASYLRIPIIVTDKIDQDVMNVLNDLHVTHTIICGPNIEGYGKTYRFESVDQIVDTTIFILREKFREKDPDFKIDYITLANPIDAWPPKVLDSKEIFLEEKTIKPSAVITQPKALISTMVSGGGTAYWKFKIPDDYKYCLVRFEGINHQVEGVSKFGDEVNFNVVSDTETAPTNKIITGGTGWAGNPIRDESGEIITDRLVQESLLYDQGGVEVTVSASGSYVVADSGKVSALVILEKLENPNYALMKQLSSMAPYLTAYHKGIIFAKSDFIFTADDDIVTEDTGENCPGFYVPRRNAKLVPMMNKHIYDNIHVPLNELLAQLAYIDYEDDRDIKTLREFYADNPVYIALVGGATVLPNYIYQNHLEPVGDVDGDGKDDSPYWFGPGTPSDVIYGNIDPERYDWSNLANDVYSEYPFQENVVARITGWDAQDASALIARSVFYDEIIKQYDEWKDNFGLLIGGGQDFQKPLLRQIILPRLFGKDPEEPMKLFTGYGEQIFLRTGDKVANTLEFNVQGALYEEAMREGLSDEALKEIKQDNLFNKLFFNWFNYVNRLAGESVARGAEIMKTSNFIFANGHGCQNAFGMAGNDLTAAGYLGPIFRGFLGQSIVPALGGFKGPGMNLGDLGDYSCRAVSNMDLGPSFMWLESCICGKIDGMYPKASIGQTFLHAGLASLVAASTGSNIGGGYIEPKNMKYDIPLLTNLKYIKHKLIDWKAGRYDPPHFAFRMYGDICDDIQENDVSVGLAFRNAKNSYFVPEEINWEVWWTPPLITTGNELLDQELQKDNQLYRSLASKGKGPMMESKYVSYQEYLLFGDPAFNPYEPVNEG